MKYVLSLGVVLVLLAAYPAAALAHGGVYRGPRGSVPPGVRGTSDTTQPPPPPPAHLACDCEKVGCTLCSHAGLEKAKDLSVRTHTTSELERWGDVARIETEIRFETRVPRVRTEGFVRFRRGPVLAVVGGAVDAVRPVLTGRLRPSVKARRDYLWERQVNRDPLLVLQRSAREVDIRVFPVRKRRATRAYVVAYVLADAPEANGLRLYRTGDRFLAVMPLERVSKGEIPHLMDVAGRRVLIFLSADEAHERYGLGAFLAAPVPFVHALESALRGTGSAAVNLQTALVALPAGRRAPANLVVGTDTKP